MGEVAGSPAALGGGVMCKAEHRACVVSPRLGGSTGLRTRAQRTCVGHYRCVSGEERNGNGVSLGGACFRRVLSGDRGQILRERTKAKEPLSVLTGEMKLPFPILSVWSLLSTHWLSLQALQGHFQWAAQCNGAQRGI